MLVGGASTPYWNAPGYFGPWAGGYFGGFGFGGGFLPGLLFGSMLGGGMFGWGGDAYADPASTAIRAATPGASETSAAAISAGVATSAAETSAEAISGAAEGTSSTRRPRKRGFGSLRTSAGRLKAALEKGPYALEWVVRWRLEQGKSRPISSRVSKSPGS